MQTLAILAAKHAALMPGIGLGALPVVGWYSLDGVAVGMLLAGIGFVVLSARRIPSCPLPPAAGLLAHAQGSEPALGRMARFRRRVDGLLTGMLSDDVDRAAAPQAAGRTVARSAEVTEQRFPVAAAWSGDYVDALAPARRGAGPDSPVLSGRSDTARGETAAHGSFSGALAGESSGAQPGEAAKQHRWPAPAERAQAAGACPWPWLSDRSADEEDRWSSAGRLGELAREIALPPVRWSDQGSWPPAGWDDLAAAEDSARAAGRSGDAGDHEAEAGEADGGDQAEDLDDGERVRAAGIERADALLAAPVFAPASARDERAEQAGPARGPDVPGPAGRKAGLHPYEQESGSRGPAKPESGGCDPGEPEAGRPETARQQAGRQETVRPETADESFWGPGGADDEAASGGYRSRYRPDSPAKDPKQGDGRRTKPRHAAPPASFGATITRRLTSTKLTSRSAAHAGG